MLPLFISSSVTALAAKRSIGKYSYNVSGLGGSYTTGSLKKVSRTSAVNNNTTIGGGRYKMVISSKWSYFSATHASGYWSPDDE